MNRSKSYLQLKHSAAITVLSAEQLNNFDDLLYYYYMYHYYIISKFIIDTCLPVTGLPIIIIVNDIYMAQVRRKEMQQMRHL